MIRMMPVLAIALGGAAGALLRWSVASFVQHRFSASDFPYGTLAVNVVGCFLIGVCYVVLVERLDNSILRQAVNIGFIGSLTTFSTYCIESYNLFESREYLAGAMNLFGSVLLGMIAVVLGIMVAKLF